MPADTFSQLPDIFQIYSALFHEHHWNQENVIKIAEHMHNIFLTMDLGALDIKFESLDRVKDFFWGHLESKSTIFSILWIYCYGLKENFN